MTNDEGRRLPSIPDSIGRLQPREATSPDELKALRRKAFIEQGVVTIRLAEVPDAWTKQAILNEARRQMGVPQQPVAMQGGRR